jgi:hypothetical protein
MTDHSLILKNLLEEEREENKKLKETLDILFALSVRNSTRDFNGIVSATKEFDYFIELISDCKKELKK